MNRSRLLTPLFIAALWGAFPSVASADEAQDLFQAGREQLKAGNTAKACQLFEQSLAIKEGQLGTELNLGVCYEKLGKTASALKTFKSAAGHALRSGEKDREKFARERIKELEPKVSRVTIEDGKAGEHDIKLDGKPFSSALAGVPRPIDPGKHQLSVSAKGKKPWNHTFEVPKEKSDLKVEVPMLEDAPQAAPPPTPTPAPVVPAPTPTPAPSPEPAEAKPGPPVAGYVSLGVGGVAVLVGAVTGGIALSKGGDVKDNCQNNTCTGDDIGTLDTANTMANVSNVTFAVGAVGIAVGAILVAVHDDGSEEAAGWRPEPTANGVRWRF